MSATHKAPEVLSYSIPDAARAIGVGRSTIYLMINDNRLASFLIGRRRLIPAASLRALIGETA